MLGSMLLYLWIGLTATTIANDPAPDPAPDRANQFASNELAWHMAAVRYAALTPAATGPVTVVTIAAQLPVGYTAIPGLTWSTCIDSGPPRRVVTWAPTTRFPGNVTAAHMATALGRLSDHDPGAGIVSPTGAILPANMAPTASVSVPASSTCGTIPAGSPAAVTRLN
jgi:hypothetical protein